MASQGLALISKKMTLSDNLTMRDNVVPYSNLSKNETVLDSLRRAPFELDDGGIAWVQATLARLNTDQKLRQLFNVALHGEDAADVADLEAFLADRAA